jgi:hypothetical protein
VALRYLQIIHKKQSLERHWGATARSEMLNAADGVRDCMGKSCRAAFAACHEAVVVVDVTGPRLVVHLTRSRHPIFSHLR